MVTGPFQFSSTLDVLHHTREEILSKLVSQCAENQADRSADPGGALVWENSAASRVSSLLAKKDIFARGANPLNRRETSAISTVLSSFGSGSEQQTIPRRLD